MGAFRSTVVWMALTAGALACGDSGSGAPPGDSGPSADTGGGDTSGGDAGAATPFCPVVDGAWEVFLVPVSIDGQATMCPPAVLDATWFSGTPNVANFYAQASAGRLTVSGSVSATTVAIGPVTGCIGMDTAQNQRVQRDVHAQIDAAAAMQGVTFPPGAIRVYALPDSIMCGARGPSAAALPPLDRIFFYTGAACQSATISAHEFGHMLSTNHASAIDAVSGTTRDVGDGSDVMGRGGLFPPNGPHRAQLGWLTTDQVVTVTSPSGPVQIAPLGDDTSALPQLVRFVRPSDPTQAVYLSYRQATGLDATLGAEFVGRTSIHSFPAACPSTTPPVPKPLLLGTVGDGEAHPIAADTITIRQLSSSGTSATVEIAP